MPTYTAAQFNNQDLYKIYDAIVNSGGVSGSGTLDYLAKFTPDGTTIGNSRFFDNGTRIGINKYTGFSNFSFITIKDPGVLFEDSVIEILDFSDNILFSFNNNGGLSIGAGRVPNSMLHIVADSKRAAYMEADATYDGLAVKGGGATSATYVGKFYNSSDAAILYMADDRTVGINNSLSANNAELYVGDGARTRIGIIVNTNSGGTYRGEKYGMEVGGGTWGMGYNPGANALTFSTGASSSASFMFGNADYSTNTSKFCYDGAAGHFGVGIPYGATDATGHFRALSAGNPSDKILYAQKSDNTQRFTVRNDGQILFSSLTATQASALTGEDSAIVYVTSTNGTFTSVGFWGYENGTWVKL